MAENVLIFDYDGVLIDSLEIFMKYFIKACKKEGFGEISSKKNFLKLFEKNMYESMFEIGMTKKQVFNIINYMRNKLLKNQNKIKPFEGINEILKNLTKDNLLLVVTSNDSYVVRRYLKEHRIDYFTEIFGSDKGSSKIEKIQRIKEKYLKKKYFYIGDTKGDIKEGKNANIITIAVLWGWHSEKMLRQEKPDYIIQNPYQIKKIIKNNKI
jgi:phosphoglycolate phosphatase